MDDIRKRLEMKNPAIQVQAVWRLYSDVVKKCGKSPVNASTPQILELKALWEGCSSPDPVVSETSSQALVKLVVNKAADFTYVVNGLLNIVPSARSLRGVVPALSQLLLLQTEAVMESGKPYICPYSIRTPPHPFITVLTNRPESWLMLQQQVYNICVNNPRTQEVAVKIISPFVKFVFLEPQQMAEYQPIRTGLQRALIDACNDGNETTAKNIVALLVAILHCWQLENSEQLCQLNLFLLDLLRTSCRLSWKEQDMSVPSRLLSVCLDVLQPSWSHGIDASRLEKEILNCAQTHPKALCTEKNVATLCDLLMAVPASRSLTIIQLANQLLSCQSVLPRCLAAMMVLPLLQILGAPQTEMTGGQKAAMVSAADALTAVEKIIRENHDTPQEMVQAPLPSCTAEGYNNALIVSLARVFSHNSDMAFTWLDNMTASLSLAKSVPPNVTNMAAALFVLSPSEQVTTSALKALVEVAKTDLAQAPNLLPLLLYGLGKDHSPEIKLTIMETIPCLATHKFCIAPILKTIQLLSTSPRLKAVAIRLMTSLWKLQDRTFPQLLKLLTEEGGGRVVEGGIDEVVLAKAAAIRDVCQLRPVQHGGDLLSPISDILNSHTGESGSAACALALEALHALCEAEVINIKSTWSVLASQLTQDSRPSVVEKICELFSLVPLLAEDTPDFEAFQSEIIRNLWLYCHSNNFQIQGSALKALSSFPTEEFRVSYLPQQITSDFHEQAALIAAQQENPDITVDNILTFVPGVCYTRLLKTLDKHVLDDYEELLSAIVGKEVENLPRGIYHSSLRRQGAAANQGKAISGIPGFILSQHEKTNQPGLRPGLAAGLLFCYDPPVEVGRDGRPRRHYIVSHGKNYRLMFNTLLSEVPVQPSDWHRCMLMPQAWTSFVNRLFTAMLESKRAEVKQEVKKGDMSEADAENALDSVWLWVRDDIADLIKTASRGNPTMQGNSVLALAGLAVAVQRYATGLDDDQVHAAESSGRHMSHVQWLTVVMDTITCLMEVTFKPKGKILGLCQQRTAGDKLPASLLARSASCVSLSQLVPIFVTVDSDRIYQVAAMLAARLPGQPGCEESPVLQFHYGLGLGMFLARLFEEHISDVGGTKGMLEVWKIIDIFENCCLSAELENRSGCVLGVGLALSGLCEEGKTESRAHVSAMLDKLVTLWKNTQPGEAVYQTLSVSLSCVAAKAFSTTIMDADRMKTVLDSLVQAHQDNLENTGVCLALGTLCYNLSKIGYPMIGQLRNKLLHDWLKAVITEETPPMQKVAFLNGVMALIGSERTLIAVLSSGTSLLSSDVDVDGVIKMATSIVTQHSDLGIQSNSAWMLGHLYLSACAVTETRASVPPSYSYLPESSVLRALVDLLIEAGKRGPEFIPAEHVKLALTAIQEEVKQVLPPVNWAGVLSPFMRVNFGTDVRRLSLKLGVSQSMSAPTATMFVSSWLTPPLFNSLQRECKECLHESLPYLIKSVAPAILKTFLEQGCMEPFKDQDTTLCATVLGGLNLALTVRDPPESVTNILYWATQMFYGALTPQLEVELYSLMSECLSSLPDDRFDQVTIDDFNQSESFLKGTFVRCYLVANGRQPLALLNSCINYVIHSQHQDQRVMVCLIGQCFRQMVDCKSDNAGAVVRSQWLLELLGYIRNLTTGNINPLEDAPPLKQVLLCAVEVVAMAISLWTCPSTGMLLGLSPSLLDSEECSKGGNQFSDYSKSLPTVLPLLSGCVSLMEREPWDQILAKVTDWLLTLTESSSTLPDPCQTFVQDSLTMLRHTKQFRKAVLWTRVFSQTAEVVL